MEHNIVEKACYYFGDVIWQWVSEKFMTQSSKLSERKAMIGNFGVFDIVEADEL
ncbi:hypothetical protein [Nitrosomonas sp. Nm132]|jgi:hypothetical protein|uniref:hypothetical protein n=1 Tax=Nitrosomonas sp. Nm132 TaxID=1881053 RepID=UPI0015A21C05|nr:hypothetical protein [Nitrosomonas sp. Nm132]